jgi:hypothetical protein
MASASENLNIAELRLLLFQCLENCDSGLCATPQGEDLINDGMKLLGVPSLHERYEENLKQEWRKCLDAVAKDEARTEGGEKPGGEEREK